MRPFAVGLCQIAPFEHSHRNAISFSSAQCNSAQPRKTIAGSSDATLRNDKAAAPRQSVCVPTKTRAASVGETFIFISYRDKAGASPLASAITGETLYVDCGYNIMGF